MKVIIDFSTPTREWSKYELINKSLIRNVIRNILNKFANLQKIKEVELSILFTNDTNISYLNHKFRGEKKPTNVLSFPDIELNWQHLLEFKPNLQYMYLGDIAFSHDIIMKEALMQHKTFEQHFTHLLVHSVLHLLGFDHLNKKEQQVMQQLEILILQDFSIPSPY